MARFRGRFYWRKIMNFKTAVQVGMGVTGFGIWSYMAYMDPALQGDYLQFVKGAVVGIAALALRDMSTSKNQPAQPEAKKDEVQP
jgi:hypothetical protein